MNRILKFRVWDVKNKEFGSDILVSLVLDAYLATQGKPDLSKNHDKYNGKKYVIQQFTGLLDKNGKEIYEGDICFGGENSIIKWNDSQAKFDGLNWFAINQNRFVVIGNIFENPELLKNDQGGQNSTLAKSHKM